MLPPNREPRVVSLVLRRNIQLQFHCSGFIGHHHRRQESFPLAAREIGKRLLQFLGRVSSHSDRAQNRPLHLGFDEMPVAPDVPVVGVDPEQGCGPVE